MLNSQDEFFKALMEIIKTKPAHEWPLSGGFACPPDFVCAMGHTGLGKSFKPSILYLKKIFVWSPEVLFDLHSPKDKMILCPNCNRHEDVRRNGWIDEPRQVVLEDDIGYAVCRRYDCNTCKIDFNGFTPGVLMQLPFVVSEYFPFIMTHKSGILKSLVRDLEDQSLNGVGMAGFRKSLMQKHLDKFHRSEMLYYATLKSLITLCEEGSPLVWNTVLRNAINAKNQFGSFGDPSRYNGFVPSESYFTKVWTEYFYERKVMKTESGVWVSRETMYHLANQQINGNILSGDASHKVLHYCF